MGLKVLQKFLEREREVCKREWTENGRLEGQDRFEGFTETFGEREKTLSLFWILNAFEIFECHVSQMWASTIW